ncbi:MAG: aminotransferase [Candidatus Taylorbacteria bacterium CG11_big_fil_rev_8_21_14_0_20_46_11]|uniref:Aminotransferase n=1 Tax=Candidatus Taylorbacteria bacterium CG11_big_fil_rev_8_21_14_0_20_46_11 TaxID=1975025 RepID=A0A2H0KBW3_9BACT|nr:MAG: aminotransferase [Candidatus Taylorbacteria bacterium CG11_big_fil_rev_8_21_14_0_20_46_11]
MSITLTVAEKKVAGKLAGIKEKSGSHSPSPAMLSGVGVIVRHDFCYLSNPHATDLFLKRWRKDFSREAKLRNLVELYPSQNRALAEKVGEMVNVSSGHIFVGNGATEVIQAVLHNFTEKKMLVPVPTFSPYLEFAPKSVRVIQHQLEKTDLFRLDLHKLLAEIRREKPDTVVIINPNNPEGGLVNANDLHLFLKRLRGVETVIVDESFIHFSGRKIESIAPLVKKYPNLIVIKSLSKDFGIAGLRLGYGVMSEKRVSALLERGYLWNVSGFGEYFLNLLNNKTFLKEYEQARLRAIEERDAFFTELQKIRTIKVYPSKANMFLMELLDGSKASDLSVRLLVRHGIYIRTCYDKVGLNGEFIRIASRTTTENLKLIGALKNILPE